MILLMCIGFGLLISFGEVRKCVSIGVLTCVCVCVCVCVSE